MDLKDALLSISGKSPLADMIIQRRFGDMVSESAATPSSQEITASERDIIVDAIADATYNGKGDRAVRELTSVILNLLDQLAVAHEGAPSEDKDGMDDDETVSRAMELFRESIKGARIGDLKCYYTEQMFKTMQPETRKSVASELVNLAADKNKEPAHIWSLLAQNNGHM